MFDAWSGILTLGGAGALSYLAAGQVQKETTKPTLRLSLDKSGSLLGDVRLLGGALTTGAAYWVKDGKAKKVLSGVALASFASLICTELVRFKLRKTHPDTLAPAPWAPAFFAKASTSYGALPAPGAGAYGGDRQYQGAWAGR